MEKKTIKSLQDQLKKIDAEINRLTNERLDKEVSNAYEKYLNAVLAFEKKNEKKVENLRNSKFKIIEEMSNIKKSRDITHTLSPKLLNWFRQYKSGIDWGYKDPKIVWYSNDERFVIFTSPGSTAGTGTAMGSSGYYYSPSMHYLIDTESPEYGLHSNKMGFKITDHEGRLTKEIKNHFIKCINTYLENKEKE